MIQLPTVAYDKRGREVKVTRRHKFHGEYIYIKGRCYHVSDLYDVDNNVIGRDIKAALDSYHNLDKEVFVGEFSINNPKKVEYCLLRHNDVNYIIDRQLNKFRIDSKYIVNEETQEEFVSGQLRSFPRECYYNRQLLSPRKLHLKSISPGVFQEIYTKSILYVRDDNVYYEELPLVVLSIRNREHIFNVTGINCKVLTTKNSYYCIRPQLDGTMLLDSYRLYDDLKSIDINGKMYSTLALSEYWNANSTNRLFNKFYKPLFHCISGRVYVRSLDNKSIYDTSRIKVKVQLRIKTSRYYSKSYCVEFKNGHLGIGKRRIFLSNYEETVEHVKKTLALLA